MIKLLIADDEEVILYGYKNAIDWEKHGVEVVGLAENGVQALELAIDKKPDIVMTDIVMPKMNGIQLITSLKEMYPKIRTIIMSGHDEFEFAKSAIQNGVSNYLLKPVRTEMILEEVLRLKVEIEEELKKRKVNEEMRKKLLESIPLLRAQYMNTLLNSISLEEQAVEEKLAYLDINISSKNVGLMVIQLDSYAPKSKPLNLEEFYAEYMQIKEICYEVMGRDKYYFVFEDRNDRMVVFLNYDKNIIDMDYVEFMTSEAEKIQNKIQDKLGETASIGISKNKSSISMIGQAYKEAISALEHRFFMGNNSIVFIGDVHIVTDEILDYPQEIEDEIIKAIRMGNYENTCNLINAFFSAIGKPEKKSKKDIYSIATILINSIYRSLIKLDNSESDEFNRTLLRAIKDFQEKEVVTFANIIDELKKTLYIITRKINSDRDIRKNSLVQNAVEYIQKNISKDVSLQTVADAVYISPNYLSSLFKENFSESFKDFVIRVKIEKAQELLQTTDLKVKQVADAVGYNDCRYFTKTFKKITGKCPEEFKA
jgi:two-component system response regulator YesN